MSATSGPLTGGALLPIVAQGGRRPAGENQWHRMSF